MKAVGIIAEYNPFHKGHQYHIREALKKSGAAHAVVVMSGDFVQRGAPAFVDKYTRTAMALSCGASLVLELPVRCATGSAEFFATGAVSLLAGSGIVDSLCFGCEQHTPALFESLANLLCTEPKEYKRILKEGIARGLSWPAAREQALLSLLPQFSGEELSAFLQSPNNILGLEYCKALKALNTAIRPVMIHRQGSTYHSFDLEGPFASASAIRHSLTEQRNPVAVRSHIPDAAYHFLEQRLIRAGFLTSDDFSLPLYYALLKETPDSILRYQDMTHALANRIFKKLDTYRGFIPFVQMLKTKELTFGRIQRALIHVLLGLTREDAAAHKQAGFIRILGFRRRDADLLHELKHKSRLPVLTKLTQKDQRLSPVDCALFEQDVFASHLYQSTAALKTNHTFPNEYTRSPVIL